MKAVRAYRRDLRNEKVRKSKAVELRKLVRQSVEAFEDKTLQMF